MILTLADTDMNANMLWIPSKKFYLVLALGHLGDAASVNTVPRVKTQLWQLHAAGILFFSRKEKTVRVDGKMIGTKYTVFLQENLLKAVKD